MQPIKYLHGVGSLGKAEPDMLLIEYQGKRYTIPNPNALSGPEEQEGLGFIASLIGAGAKIIGGLVKKKKPAPVASAAPAAPSGGGFARGLINRFAGGGSGGGIASSLSAGGGPFSALKDQFLDLKSGHKDLDNKLNNQQKDVEKQNNLLTQSNAEVQRLLDNVTGVQKDAEDKLAAMKDIITAQEHANLLREQEQRLKDEIRREANASTGDTSKLLTYGGLAAAGFFLFKTLNGTGLAGVEPDSATSSKPKEKKSKTIKI